MKNRKGLNIPQKWSFDFFNFSVNSSLILASKYILFWWTFELFKVLTNHCLGNILNFSDRTHILLEIGNFFLFHFRHPGNRNYQLIRNNQPSFLSMLKPPALANADSPSYFCTGRIDYCAWYIYKYSFWLRFYWFNPPVIIWNL